MSRLLSLSALFFAMLSSGSSCPSKPFSIRIVRPSHIDIIPGEHVTLSTIVTNAKGKVRYQWTFSPDLRLAQNDQSGLEFDAPEPSACDSDLALTVRATDELSGQSVSDNLKLKVAKVWCVFPDGPGGLLSSHISKLAHDSPNLWIGTPLGLNQMNANGVEVHHAGKAITALAADKGEVWAGFQSAGMQHLKRTSNVWGSWDSAPLYGTEITAIASSENKIYVGSIGSGLSGYSGVSIFDQTQWAKIGVGYTYGARANYVGAIAITRSKELWIGADATGVYRFAPGKTADGVLVDEKMSQGTLATNARAMLEDEQGNLWIGLTYSPFRRRGGVVRYTPSAPESQAWKNFTTADGLAGDDIRAFAMGSEQNLWAASSTGLSRHRPPVAGQANGSWQAFTRASTKGSLPCDDLGDLAYDQANNYLWIASNGCGLIRLLLSRL